MKCRGYSVCLLLGMLAAGCGRVEAPEERWYRDLRGGELITLPFSHDLELLGYQGWRFLGKLPRDVRPARTVRFSIWYDLTEGAVEPIEIISHRPQPGTPHGAWILHGPEDRRVEVDILLERNLDTGIPVYIAHAWVNRQEIRRHLELPEAFRHRVSLSTPPDDLEIRPGEPLPLATARIESWTASGPDQSRLVREVRDFTWYLLLEIEEGE